MALSQSDLMQLLQSRRTADGVETIRMLCERILQELVEAETTEAIGAARSEHSKTRTTWRNGHRERLLTTQARDLDLKIPKVRTGSFFPSLLERRRCNDRALFAVVVEAYVHGVSTRSVDDLVKALGADSGISKSEVSRICGELDAELTAFKERPFWTKFLRSLRARGLENVQLVISDSHSGLVAAIRTVFLGAAWQGCGVHFVRNLFSVIEKGSGEMVAATIRTIFAQTTAAAVRTQLDVVADLLGRQFPQVRKMLLDAATDITAFADFPPPGRRGRHRLGPARVAALGPEAPRGTGRVAADADGQGPAP